MFRKLYLLIAAFLCLNTVFAQADSSHLRITLLTCGVGDEIWETFGHTALRVTDSVAGTDNVYNYGTFGFDKDFEIKFMRGKLLYYVSYYPFSSFMEEYIEAKRSVQEQVLLLSGAKKVELYNFLIENAREENKYYKYDFFFDNCATRIRDAFPRSLGAGFKFANVLPAGQKLTFRDIINLYFYKVHFERFGINLLLGSRIDKVMSNEDIMFLPDFLRDGIAGAVVDGKKVSTPPVLLEPGSEFKPAGINWVLVMTLFTGFLTIIGLSYKPMLPVGNIMSFLMLLVTGLLGLLMLVMWLGTDHQGCQNNYNILWALPTNLMLAFASKKNKSRYAVLAIILIAVALLLHIAGVQKLPLYELWPWLLALLFIYGNIYRKAKLNA